MFPWIRRFAESTRGRVVELLRRQDLTVEEMAAALELTDNAIRAQLATLERDGMVEPRGLRRGPGKPSATYGVAPDFEVTLSRAYVPLAVRLLDEIASRVPPRVLMTIVRAAGKRWAADVPPPIGGLSAKARWGAGLLNELGGQVEVRESGHGELVLQGASCPLSAVVRAHPRVCVAIESLLADRLAVPVVEQCDRSEERPRCRFLIGVRPARAPARRPRRSPPAPP